MKTCSGGVGKRVAFVDPKVAESFDGAKSDPVALIRWWTRVLHYAVIKLDFDTSRRPTVARMIDRLTRARLHLDWVVLARSPSGRGWHAWVGVFPPPKNAVQTVALQAILGSDPRREAYNFNRAFMVDAGQVPDWYQGQWNIFYRRPQV